MSYAACSANDTALLLRSMRAMPWRPAGSPPTTAARTQSSTWRTVRYRRRRRGSAVHVRRARPVNKKEAKIHGWEFGGQYFFGDTGFGVLANYTIVKGDVGYDVAAIRT